MKKFFNYFTDGKAGLAFLTAYLLIFIINGLKALLLFNSGNGDIFYRLFSLLSDYFKSISGVVNPVLSMFGFIGSFYWVIVSPLIYLIFVSLYAAVVQLLLHATMRSKPKRFSITLSIIFTSAGFFYIIKVVPILGGLLFSFMFLYVSGVLIAKKNDLNKWRGVFMCLLPFILVFVFGLSLFFSILGTASFF